MAQPASLQVAFPPSLVELQQQCATEPAGARPPAFFCGARPASCYRARPKQCGLVKPALAAGVAELVDAPDLGSGDESLGGSSPSARTIPSPPRAS